MAAATQSNQTLYDLGAGKKMFTVDVSAMTSDQPETISYNYASCPALKPTRATMEIKTAPTARCVLSMECDVSLADTAAKTCPVRFYTEAGGDITGAVVRVRFEFPHLGATPTGVAL